MSDNNYIKSPLNYVGGKYKLLPQIIPLFPKDIDTFYDLFCGGCNVAINVDANKIVANDIMTQVVDLFDVFQFYSKDEIFKTIEEIIKIYGLATDCKQDDKEAYLKLRYDYNKNSNIIDKIFMLYVLVCYSFSNQMRFNSKGEFNMPYGERHFNKNMRKNLSLFLEKLYTKNIDFMNFDFVRYAFRPYNKNDFVYVDPPYSNTTATYNENGGWTKNDDKDLFDFLDRLHDSGIRFAMSNILKNDWLTEWSKKYNVHFLKHNYKNCNYQKKDRSGKEQEVLITNY